MLLVPFIRVHLDHIPATGPFQRRFGPIAACNFFFQFTNKIYCIVSHHCIFNFGRKFHSAFIFQPLIEFSFDFHSVNAFGCRISLPPRKAHPVISFRCESCEPLVCQDFPFDKYELEPSPLTRFILERKQPGVCWQV